MPTNALPPAATITIEFGRDIQPILESTCLRCHGPPKPKSHFRLDNRASALKGGDNNTNDIVPGDSARSFLAHYVARQVPDMEMPPINKGNPLTPQQVGLLRAWIDQGAIWNPTNPAPQLTLRLESSLRWVGVHGDESKFRELEGREEGFGGGVDEVLYTEQSGTDETLSLEGHAIAPDHDYRLKLALNETDHGFVHAGFEEWRKYYDDTGGYDPALTPPEFNLNRDLYVDNGRLWVDLGLTLPRWPQIVLGYEYQSKQGNKSMLDWGEANGENVNIAPSTKAINEQTHIIKLDVTHDFDDWHLEDNARVEFYYEKNRSDETNAFQAAGLTETRDSYHHVQGMNTLMLEKQIRDWWYLSGGEYYSRLEGSDFFNQTNGAFGFSWSSDRITLRRESEIFSLASLFTPLEYLSFSVSTQNEWTREEGFGGNVPDFEQGTYAPANSNLHKFKAGQNANLRFTRIPYTVLFADAQLEEDNISEFQEQNPTFDPTAFTRHTDATEDRYNLRAGFNASPWRWSALNAQYRRKYSNTDYSHLVDEFNNLGGPTNGYPAFILGRRIQSDGFETKLDLRPARWLKTTLTCQIATTDYSTTTDPTIDLGTFNPISPGGTITAGKDDTQTYGAGVTLTPIRQLYLTSAFTYTYSHLTTASHGDPSVVPYRGHVYTVMGSASYALNARTGVQAAYNFSHADYGQNNPAGVPLGIDFTRHQLSAGLTRQLTQSLSGALRYVFSEYSEPSSGNANNFTAHGIFATLDYQWR